MDTHTEIQTADIREIARQHGLRLIDSEPIAAGAARSSYLLQTQRGGYVLTLCDDMILTSVLQQAQLLLVLEEQHFPAPRLLPAADGRLATTHQGTPVIIKRHIQGDVHRDLEHAMLRQVGAAMARLHQIPAPEFLSARRTYGLRKLAAIQGQEIDPKYEAWITHRVENFEERKPQQLPRGLIHGDLFYDNVLFDEQELRAVIDFEDASVGALAFDLGMAIVGLCRRKTAIVLDRARALLRGYEQVRSLKAREKDVLQFYTEYAAAAVSCWRYWKYQIDSPSLEKADQHWRMARTAEYVRNIPPSSFVEQVLA